MRFLDNPAGALRAVSIASGIIPDGPGRPTLPGGGDGPTLPGPGGRFGPGDGGGLRRLCDDKAKAAALKAAAQWCEDERARCADKDGFECSIAWDDKNCKAMMSGFCPEVEKLPEPEP